MKYRISKIIPIIAMLFIFALFANATMAQVEQGKIIAGIDFEPERDGFKFRNYGRDHDGSNDLDAEDLIMMFGANKACIEGSKANDCVLYQTAEHGWKSGLK